MINLMLQNRQPIIYGDGKQKRCFSYVTMIFLFERNGYKVKKVLGQTINIGPDEEFITINELAEKIANQLKSKSKP